MLILYGKTLRADYSVISEKSKCSTLRFYASIESRYGGNRFAIAVRIRYGNFFTVGQASGVAHMIETGQSAPVQAYPYRIAVTAMTEPARDVREAETRQEADAGGGRAQKP